MFWSDLKLIHKLFIIVNILIFIASIIISIILGLYDEDIFKSAFGVLFLGITMPIAFLIDIGDINF